MYTNTGEISLALAVWLAADDGYDLKPDEKTISVTTLLDPVKSVVLSKQLTKEDKAGTVDISDLIPSRLGTAVHTAAEVAWLYSRQKALKNLGIPQHVIDRINLNPDEPTNGIDIYLEQRTQREIEGYKISGKYDFVVQGQVEDIKTTKTYNYINGSNNKKYALQGSIYRWLNPTIITKDHVAIHYMFTDWSPLKAQADKSYPQKKIITKLLPLLSIEATEDFVRQRVLKIDSFMDKKQKDLPACTPTELWMKPSTWAFYKDATKTTRATKLFDNSGDANAAAAAIPGSLVVERKEEPTFCKYCKGRAICHQAETYIEEGILKI